MNQKLWMNLWIALEAVMANRTRSILTALGIIFGVAAVISMLAIGNGAQKEIIEQIKLVGVNNIVIKPIIEQSEEDLTDENEESNEKKFSNGLTAADNESITKIVPGISQISPEIILETYIINNGTRRSAKVIGVNPSYFDIFNFKLAEGQMFNDQHLKLGESVCIIGKSIKSKFFPTQNPVGKYLKCGNNWLKVIAVLDQRIISSNSISNLGIRDYNMDVYIPIKTMLLRFKDRARITEEMLRRANMGSRERGQQQETELAAVNYHQLDRLVVQVKETNKLMTTADVVARLLTRKHYGVVDFEIEIPELLLKQQQRTNDIFNYVLGAIAGISLLVGGIGIMNIMLASVLERIKEIGLRLSLGAQKKDIVNQFLFESMTISVTGGLIGVIMGIVIAISISKLADIPTVITISSILLSFGVSAGVGLIFGIAPARKAASQNPIESLRYE